jgi:hypothetical protein
MDSAEDSAVADFLQILEEHRRNCERQGKYVEAEIAKNRLEELKVLLFSLPFFLSLVGSCRIKFQAFAISLPLYLLLSLSLF